MKVVKFGGSSLANAEQILKVIKIIKSDKERKIVVVSAPGKRHKNDEKVTDLLISLANKVIKNESYDKEFLNIINRFKEIQTDLDLDDDILLNIENTIKNRIKNKSDNNLQFLDSIKASGEESCAKIISEAFNRFGINTSYINPLEAGMNVTNEYGNAEVLKESYSKLKSNLSNKSNLLIFPGFYGYTKANHIATFSRGGSDITGAIIAAAVSADVYENFTDVDSVFVMDPRIIDNPPAINEMTYFEMRELAYAGFGVFHDEAILPAVEYNIPISIKNTNTPESSGTLIIPEDREINNRPVAGISSSDGFSYIYIEKYMMNRQIGFGRRLLQILEEENLSYEHTPSGIDRISIILKTQQLLEKEKLLITKINEVLNPDHISINHGKALLMVVGEGMCKSIGIAAQATSALAKAGINIDMINQGASEISIMFAVKEEDRKNALLALGDVFFSN